MNNTKDFALQKKSKRGIARVFKAFAYTASGFKVAITKEHAFRQEVFTFVFLIIGIIFLPINWALKLAMIAPLFAVLAIEFINSAIEAVVDDISLEYRELAKHAKDFGSAAVCFSMMAVAIFWAAILIYAWQDGQFSCWFSK